MTIQTQARAPLRALVSASIIGSLAALALGAAYMGGSLARTMTVKSKAERLSVAAEADYSTVSLLEAAGGLDESAQAIAERHDRYAVAGAAARDRAATGMAARLERMDEKRRADDRSAGSARLLRASMTLSTGGAQPYRMSGALDASRDLDCLAQAVYYEARGEGTAGMQAVAQVVLNRARHPAFPKTICGVVYQGAARRVGCQFSFVCDGSMRRGKEPGAWRKARDIAARALGGYVMVDVGNSTHFHTTGVSPSWRNHLLRVAQIGTHVFYRFGGRAGGSDAFRYTPRPSTGMDTVRPVYASVIPTGRDDAAPAPYTILFNGQGAAPAEQAAAPAQAAHPAPAGAPAKPDEAHAAPAAAAAETTAD